MYLPSFPTITNEFNTNASFIQFSLTSCLLGLGIGQLIIGPMSDVQGRRKPLIFFLGLYFAASLACAFASTVYIFIGARFIQGFAAAGGIVISRSEEHTSELQSRGHLVCRLLLEKKKKFFI